MGRKLFVTAISFALTAVVAIAVVTFMPADAGAFTEWGAAGPNCNAGACHGNNFGGFGASLHDLHVPMTPDCNACHPSGGGSKPVQIGSSDGNTKPSCSGCHVGAGLREFHRNSAVQTCDGAGCHANPETPAAESALPPYYGTATAPAINDPCNPTAAADTNENWDGNFVGLDNDGDLLVDGNDPDCAAPAATATYNPQTGEFTSTETKVGGKGYNTLFNLIGPGFTFSLANASKVTPSGSPSCTYTGATGVLECPVVVVTGLKKTYNVIFDQLTGYDFVVRSAKKNP